MRLKAQIETELNHALKLLDERAGIIKSKNKELEALQETVAEFRLLQKHVSAARTAITAIVQVSCIENVRQQIMREFDVCQSAETEVVEEMPEITPLYASLMHIEDILNRRIEEDKPMGHSMGYSRFS